MGLVLCPSLRAKTGFNNRFRPRETEVFAQRIGMNQACRGMGSWDALIILIVLIKASQLT